MRTSSIEPGLVVRLDATARAQTEAVDVGDGTTTGEVVVVVVLVVLLVALIAGLVAWRSTHSPDDGLAEEAYRRRLGSISRRARWVIDRGIPSMTGALDPVSLGTTWRSADATVLGLQHELSSLAAVAPAEMTEPVADLASAVSSTRSALDGCYRTRTRHPDQPDLISAADQELLARRDGLSEALATYEAGAG